MIPLPCQRPLSFVPRYFVLHCSKRRITPCMTPYSSMNPALHPAAACSLLRKKRVGRSHGIFTPRLLPAALRKKEWGSHIACSPHGVELSSAHPHLTTFTNEDVRTLQLGRTFQSRSVGPFTPQEKLSSGPATSISCMEQGINYGARGLERSTDY